MLTLDARSSRPAGAPGAGLDPVSKASASPVGVVAGREEVLVLPREVALGPVPWHGIRLERVSEVLAAIPRHGRFLPRAEVEGDDRWQQVIPHLVVSCGQTVLAMRRLGRGSERRLRGQVTLGVGGHINAEDGPLEGAFLRGCLREWAEEVVSPAPAKGRLVGLIKDGAGEVGRVHLGVLVMVTAGAEGVTVREEEKLEGRLLAVSELEVLYLEMETWSQFVYDRLLRGVAGPVPVTGPEITLPASPAGPAGRLGG